MLSTVKKNGCACIHSCSSNAAECIQQQCSKAATSPPNTATSTNTNTNTVSTTMECQLVLETQAAPAIIRRVGEPQSGRISHASVAAFLARHQLKFDRATLAKMFKEADFRGQGSLAPRDFMASVSGRYPKRRYTLQWRQLVALLLGAPSVKLLDVDREPVTEEELAVHRKVRACVRLGDWVMIKPRWVQMCANGDAPACTPPTCGVQYHSTTNADPDTPPH